MKRSTFILFFCFAFALSSTACLNYYYTVDKEGDLHLFGEGDDLLPPFNKNFNQAIIVSKMQKLETKMKTEHSYMLLSDYAVSLMKLGQTKAALDILVELSANYPNEYKIASNLGTAYELNGQVDSALKYIRHGLQLNPNDHAGSEWVHVKILEAKNDLAKDPAWLESHTVLGLSEKQKQDAVVQQQILIQLQERFPFSPGPDAIMASLFVDLGDISANRNSIEYAKVFYQIAKEYYGDQSPALAAKVKEMQKLSDKYTSVKPPHVKHSGEEKIEGENVKLGTLLYKTLINDFGQIEIDWSKINTDPKSLLAEVNLKMTVKEVREAALKNQTDDLKLVADSSDKKIIAEADLPPIEQGRGKTNSWMIILLSSITAIFIGILIYRFSSKRKE
jgi:tetratricopeptide (TPR) repeat protein